MKKYRHLYPQVYEWENLLGAWRKAAKGKRGQPPAAAFELNAAENLLALQDELLTKRYAPGGYVSFTIHEPKRRLISAAPFRDRVAHHALCNVMEPLFERRFIHDSYANRKGKGTHAALDRAQYFARRYRYVLPCDVAQFFPAIDHAILLATIERVIVDPDMLWLCQTVVTSGAGVLSEDYIPPYFPGDDLFAVNRPHGLPIGNLTSQFWANVYLNPLDHFVKRELKCPAYVRFVDDMLLFGHDKATLWQYRTALIHFLAGLRLTLHATRCQPRPVAEGIPFLGFVLYPHQRRLKRRKGIAYRRRLRSLLVAQAAGDIPLAKVTASVQGWVNHVRYGQTYGLRRKMLSEL
ncbi:MAG: RNA-dependent DNA polymerase [Caldilineaceae bacterium]|nr:RNA-dependent DNA polymerase [Caldilineaceae bacterium]